MSEVWVEVTADSIRGDRDGLVELRSAINDALRGKNRGEILRFEDEQGEGRIITIERVGP